MTQRATSREELLDAAYGIAAQHGLAALSVRGLAREAGVAVGTVYNYFPSKEDLTVATAQRYFARAFYEDFCHPAPDEGFVAYCRRMAERMDETLEEFRTRWLVGVESLPAAERVAARLREERQLEHVERGLVQVFERDPRIDRSALPSGVDARSVCAFALDAVMAALRDRRHGCPVLFYLLERALYGTAGDGGPA